MITFVGLLGVGCFVATVLMTTGDPNALQIVFGAIFGFCAFVCACVVGIMALVKYLKNKTVDKVSKFINKRKRLEE